MKVEDLLRRIDNVNTTPIEVDDFRTNYNSATLSRRYTIPRGRFQLKC